MSNINQYLAAVERLDNFLANYERAGGLHREEIYSIHSIPDGEPGEIRVSDLKTLLAEIQRLTDSEDSRVVVLEAERDKLRSQLAELNNAINWHTSCLNCSSLMDTNYAQYCELERVKPVLDALGRWRDTTEHAATEALAYAYDAFVAGPGGCAGHTRKAPASTLHLGRGWVGHEMEDECPCPQAPCGLVDTGTIDPACPEHSLKAAKSTRQSHWAHECPGSRAGHTKAVADAEA